MKQRSEGQILFLDFIITPVNPPPNYIWATTNLEILQRLGCCRV